MTEKIAPALTPEEWAVVDDDVLMGLIPLGQSLPISPADVPYEFYGEPHRVAAVALYGQPFGFTREDVQDLRDSADDDHEAYKNYDKLRSIADRIEALLPPKDSAVLSEEQTK